MYHLKLIKKIQIILLIDGINYLNTYLIANEQTYSLSDWSLKGAWEAIGAGSYNDRSYGMLWIDDQDIWTTHSIDRVNERLKLTKLGWNSQTFYFGLSDWTTRYGKPVELSLALHLSTMMPDLVYEINTNPAFNTKVHIQSSEDVKIMYTVEFKRPDPTDPSKTIIITSDQIIQTKETIGKDWSIPIEYFFDKLEELITGGEKTTMDKFLEGTVLEGTGLTYFQYSDLVKLAETGQLGEAEVGWPRITEVKKHWFYKDFTFQYGTTTENQIIGNLGYTPSEGDNLYSLKDRINLVDAYIVGTSYYQIAEPEAEGPNDAIKALFKGGNGSVGSSDKGNEDLAINYNFEGKYYQFDGTRATAKEIYNAKAVDAQAKEIQDRTNSGEENVVAEMKYFEFEGKKYDIQAKTVSKKPVSFKVSTTLNDGTKLDSTKNAFTAFSILEGMHTEASKQIYRNLQDLLVSLEYFSESDFAVPSTQVLEWPIKDFVPAIWPKRDVNEYGAVVQSKNSIDKGFDADETVIAPGDATILEIGADSIKLKFKELSTETIGYLEQLYRNENITIDKNCVLDMELLITGIKVNSALAVGNNIKRGETIGTTTEKDIRFILYNIDKSIVDNIEEYISPQYEELEIYIQNDYIVNTKDSEPQIKDVATLQKAFPKDKYPVIYDNAAEFIKIQNNYGVNAIFAVAVAIQESSGGTNWDLIAEETHNMFSIKGTYENVEDGTYTDVKGGNWKKYETFAQAIDDFGYLMCNSTYYFQGGNNKISKIASKYCPPGLSWAKGVSQHMTAALDRIK